MHTRRSLVTLTLLLLPLGITSALGAADRAVVTSRTPNVSSCDQLTGATALSGSNLWVVGSSCLQGGTERTLALRWKGASWSVQKTPNVGMRSSLRRVDAISPTDVWAVGSWSRTTTGLFRTLAVHWNGAAWKVVSTPDVGSGNNSLQDVVALSPTNIWAVGYSSSGALVLHWNGSRWTTVRTPVRGGDELFGVSALSSSDIWAVGSRTISGRVRTLTLHWNGRAWSVISSPNAGVGKNNFLFGGVRAISRSDVWAVGGYNAGTESKPAFRTLVIHWNGARWAVVASPNRGQSTLYGGIASTSAIDAWAVGTGGSGTTLIEHWNGKTWSIVGSPSPGTKDNELLGVAAVAPSVAFAVGYRRNTSTTASTLVLRWTGSRWQAM